MRRARDVDKTNEHKHKTNKNTLSYLCLLSNFISISLYVETNLPESHLTAIISAPLYKTKSQVVFDKILALE